MGWDGMGWIAIRGGYSAFVAFAISGGSERQRLLMAFAIFSPFRIRPSLPGLRVLLGQRPALRAVVFEPVIDQPGAETVDLDDLEFAAHGGPPALEGGGVVLDQS